MAYFGFHGRYKKHCYEDCKDLKDISWDKILNLDPSTVPSNILTNSCIFKKINTQNYITSIQLDAIQHLLMIKSGARTKDNENYENVKNRIIKMFKTKYSEFCDVFNDFNTTNRGPMMGRDLFKHTINDNVPYSGYTPSISQKNKTAQMDIAIQEGTDSIVADTMDENDINVLGRRLKKLGGKKSSKRKRKTKRRKSKKCFSLF